MTWSTCIEPVGGVAVLPKRRTRHGGGGPRLGGCVVGCAVMLVSLAAAVAAEAPTVVARFPGPTTRVLDPTGRYAVVWVAADPARSGSRHALVLEDVASGRTRPLRVFDHWVTVLWSPDSRRLAVTDGVADDRSEVWAYRADEPAVPESVSAVLERQGKGGLKFAAGADHLYLEAVRWFDEDTVVVRAWGFGGSKRFDREIDVRLGG
jgi:hypothetical protein